MPVKEVDEAQDKTRKKKYTRTGWYQIPFSDEDAVGINTLIGLYTMGILYCQKQ